MSLNNRTSCLACCTMSKWSASSESIIATNEALGGWTKSARRKCAPFTTSHISKLTTRIVSRESLKNMKAWRRNCKHEKTIKNKIWKMKLLCKTAHTRTSGSCQRGNHWLRASSQRPSEDVMPTAYMPLCPSTLTHQNCWQWKSNPHNPWQPTHKRSTVYQAEISV